MGHSRRSLARDASPARCAWWAEAAAEGRRLAAGAADAAPPDAVALGRIVSRAVREERHAQPLAELLLPQARTIVAHAEAGDAELRGRFQSALVSLQGVAPCHGATLILAICKGWVTGWRRGRGVKAAHCAELPAATSLAMRSSAPLCGRRCCVSPESHDHAEL